MKVRDRMNVRPVTIRADAAYEDALRLMQDRALHHLPVLDDEGQLVGIVAERDLLLAAMHYLQTPVEVAQVMHRDVVTTRPDAPIAEAAALMVDHRIGGLPVVDGGAGVIGVITETDIIRAFVERERMRDAGVRG